MNFHENPSTESPHRRERVLWFALDFTPVKMKLIAHVGNVHDTQASQSQRLK